MNGKSSLHTKCICQYYIVFITNYHKKHLYGRVRNDVREIISTLCRYKNIKIVVGAVCTDYVQLLVTLQKMS